MLDQKSINDFRLKLAKKPSYFQLRSDIAKCLADPTCLKILYILNESKYVCPSNFSDILGLSLPAISHQLARLKQMGITQTVRHGQMICYFLTDSKETRIIKGLVSILI